MKTVVLPTQDAVCAAAEDILSIVCAKPDCVLAVSGGEDELAALRCAAELAEERGISMDGIRIFAACEFCGDGDGTVTRQIRRSLGGAYKGEISTPREDHCAGYDAAIEQAGGIDLAVLGLGEGASVAFNELATQYDTHTHVQKLTNRIKAEWAHLFGGADGVPPFGVTLGFKNICSARRIVVVALGVRRCDAVFNMLYGRNDSVYPAAFLQLPLEVCLFADEDAAARL